MSSMMAVMKRSLSTPYLRLGHVHLRTRLHVESPRSFNKVCIVTELSRNNGIVQGARLQLDLLRSCGVDAEIVDATPAARNPLFRARHNPATAYIFHSGGPQMPNLIRSVLPSVKNAYRIAYWAWEMPVPPRGYDSPDCLVHEIWTCSQFAKSSLQQLSSVPVRVVPHIIHKAAPSPKQLGAPFEVLAFADSRSSLARKNPLGAIHAFQQAFGQSHAARLTLKLNGRPEELAPVIEQAKASNIRVLTEFLSPGDLTRLYDSSHVLLSLHRAEGFGLPMFEAMSRGLPVIATAWSGNLDFMSPENSLPVPSKSVPIGNDPVYRSYADALWAEPDTGVAARYLRQLASDGEFYHRSSTLALDAVANFTTNQRQRFAVETLHA